ncbi:SulP family inorganic anion transporter [Aliarcobacter butzleri]|uniref:SulP family inorganic anion transporter n=1 Tax=Aliarcobacter TaxID=2321111 RepID=UPI00100B4638|nr:MULTISPECIES: SulP family inorganic anion transporter [Aliarcobacter]MCG3706988.1 SulP family inorganic anion transporter [Aliarcobacter butzleri]MDN5096701.1 SulP family inorganic anion transporter [Aliarcobacter butzleri]MDN5128453.1 SulP family inorganic anion transporter [Aliarcobacter butzleri]QEZ89048.1 sulfate permease [Aliarcobacter cibarius]RXI25359.1 sodium-independent anion transporter [Aliarcobacter trophiarum]
MIKTYFKKDEWFGNIRGDILSGLVVALALIPEAIAFSIIAGVDPKIGLYASFCIAVVISFFGGRPGMISAATGAMALLMVTLVKDYGLQYLLAATLLTGVFQIIAGYLQLGRFMSFVPRAVVIGFVNALAILIFMAQLPELINVTWHVYALTIVGLGIIYLFPYIPKIGKILPSPLVTIITLTLIVYFFGIDIRNVGDMGQLPDTLPIFLFPDIPLNLETLLIILPYSLSLAVVGLLESLMTATIVDEMTDTNSDKNRECKGQGVANIASGLMGGMAGCAMIGQSVINIKSGGRGRLSTFIAGFLLLIMVVFLSDVISIIPMAALVAVMIMVSIGTFNWGSFKDLKSLPLSTNIVMLSTVAVTVYTHNLAFGVFTGVLLASLFFANKISHFMYSEIFYNDNKTIKTYKIVGQVFFNSADKFYKIFDFKENIDKVVIDLTRAHFWDVTAVYALDKSVLKLRKEGKEVEIIGQNEASSTIIDRFGIHDKPEEIDRIMGGH